MAVDPATTIPAFDTTLPTSADFVSEGDDNFRMIKSVLKTTFPNLGGAWNATAAEANYIVGVTSPIQTQLNAKGARAGQTWTGTHDYTGATITVPTLAQTDNSTNAASTAYVTTKAFAAALPVQAGNSGKYVKTDGTNASWSFITFAELTSKPTTVGGYGITDLLQAGSGGFGYGIGSGGTVTQPTSKTTAVTLNKNSGAITMNSAALPSGAPVTFLLNNSLIAANDGLHLDFNSDSLGTFPYSASAVCKAGQAYITVRQDSGSSFSDAAVIRFRIIKGATA